MLALSTDSGCLELPPVSSIIAERFWTALAVWFFVTFWYKAVSISYILGLSWKDLSSLLAWRIEHIRNNVCPFRRARLARCAQRCARRRRRCQELSAKIDSSSNPPYNADGSRNPKCALGASAAHFSKLILPPPLPFRKRTRKAAASNNDTILQAGEKHTTVDPPTTQKEPYGLAETATAGLKNTPQQQIPRFYDIPQHRVALIDQARMQQWEGILQHVSRKEAKYRDIDGLYPLHWVCSGGPPIEVVQVVLAAYPSAAKKVDNEGSTPLHFATHYSASASVIEALQKIYPKANRMQDKYGRTPLYHAVDKCANIEVLKLLVNADPALVLKPCLPEGSREVPISRAVALRTPLFVAWAAVASDRQARTKLSGKKWEKAQLLLEAATLSVVSQNPSVPRPVSLLSSAIKMDLYLPEQVLSMAVRSDPEQLKIMDPGTGQLPLALAASTRHYSPERSQYVIQLLLEAYPEAARARNSTANRQRSVLALALASGKQWFEGVEDVFRADPESLHTRDGATGLSPVLLAATAAADGRIYPAAAPESSNPNDSDDPYRLLSSKQHELLAGQRRYQRHLSNSDYTFEKVLPKYDKLETMQLDSLYRLLVADPSAIVSGASYR